MANTSGQAGMFAGGAAFGLLAGAALMALFWRPAAAPEATAPPPVAVPEVPAAPVAREPGSHEKLRTVIAAAPELEVIISDVVIPPNGTVPSHYHPGEEFLYVIEGEAVHVEAGQPDRVLTVGDSYAIPPRAIHAPRGGPDGARAIVFRVHLAGQPERLPAVMPAGQ